MLKCQFEWFWYFFFEEKSMFCVLLRKNYFFFELNDIRKWMEENFLSWFNELNRKMENCMEKKSVPCRSWHEGERRRELNEYFNTQLSMKSNCVKNVDSVKLIRKSTELLAFSILGSRCVISFNVRLFHFNEERENICVEKLLSS